MGVFYYANAPKKATSVSINSALLQQAKAYLLPHACGKYYIRFQRIAVKISWPRATLI